MTTALITGSTSGIGRATAVALARRGVSIVITGRDRDRAGRVQAEIEREGGTAAVVLADLAIRDEVQRLADEAIALAGGAIEILVNNADEPYAAPMISTSREDFDRIFAVNVRAAAHLVTELGPRMVETGHGTIVNVSGTASRFGVPGLGLYGAAKAAVSSLTRTWAAELGPTGVRVNAVELGAILTPRSEAMAGVLTEVMATSPSRRIGTADEVADVIAFLVSPSATYIHGAVIGVDGGQAITLPWL